MAEYVVKGAEPNETVLHSRTPNGYEAWHWLPVLERIVRCKDCKHWGESFKGCKRNPCVEAWHRHDFCSYGERREP